MVDGTPQERPHDAEGRQALMEFRELFVVIERAARAAASHIIQAADSEDVVQYVCIDAWERWAADREYFRRRSPAGWATVAARHHAYSVLDAAGTRQRRDAAFMAGYVRQPRVWMDPHLGWFGRKCAQSMCSTMPIFIPHDENNTGLK